MFWLWFFVGVIITYVGADVFGKAATGSMLELEGLITFLFGIMLMALSTVLMDINSTLRKK